VKSEQATKRYKAFLRDGLRADKAMQRSGLGYAAGDVRAYLTAKVQGRTAERPAPNRWRRK
jgi:hypothetical protein